MDEWVRCECCKIRYQWWQGYRVVRAGEIRYYCSRACLGLSEGGPVCWR